MRYELDLFGEHITLLAERALFWHRHRWLVAGDLHLGKAGHFQRRGIALPSGSQEKTLARLNALIQTFRPERVIFLGDLFHSARNREWEDVREWLSRHPPLFTLVMGNHEILPERIYTEMGLDCVTVLEQEPFVFRHEPPLVGSAATERDGRVHICGHLHPSIRIAMAGRQRVTLPCFHLSGDVLTLPAFGDLTGRHRIQPQAADRVYAIADSSIIQIQNP